MKRLKWISALVLMTGVNVLAAEPAIPDRVQFNRDIRPILSDTCFKCHGFDKGARKAGLRLDTSEGAYALKDGHAAIVPGDLKKSQAWLNITTKDEEDRMPPPKSGMKLTDRQIKLIGKWIEQGAKYEGHWAFIPPTRPAVPAIENRKSKIENAIDAFVFSKLESHNLSPRPQADKITLIRRVTFDLTGLPPTVAEVDAFLADTSADAYEKVVDRLLASPRYGERMAVDWLDAARFADTHGYHIDAGRDMSRWREWVINAFNSNKPFDQFTIEQFAGDLLPNATVEQKVATGFHRNHMINFEGGAIPEEYHNNYIVDRVNTMSTVWLGLTLNCTQCHDHKYDPLTQKDFYSFYAFFHNVPENGLDGSKGNAAPFVRMPNREESEKLATMDASIGRLKRELAGPLPQVADELATWEKSAAAAPKTVWTELALESFKSAGGATIEKMPDGSAFVTGANPAQDTYTITLAAPAGPLTGIRVEALADDRLTAKGPGRSSNGNLVLTDVKISAGKPMKIKSASADFSQEGYPVAYAIDNNAQTGWAIYPQAGVAHQAVFELTAPAKLDGKAPLTVTLAFNHGAGQHSIGRFKISATAAPNPHKAAPMPANISAILAVASDRRTDAQKSQLLAYFKSSQSPTIKKLTDELSAARKAKTELENAIPTTMVMQEMAQPRNTFTLIRGQYDKKGEKVTAQIPKLLGDFPAGAPKNRLGLAQWLVNPKNPLVSRVIVNRYWQLYFGYGLVKTVEDFGAQGEWPVNPELLDWLAVEFMESGWNIKHMQRLIVTSSAYRQSAVVTPELLAADPENRLISRGPRLRLQAEFIRDQALMVSGLLDPRIGGPSVSPYQPEGIWEELSFRADFRNWSAQTYTQSHGQDLYRRTMYTFWKRTVPPPQLSTFDAPDREVCTVKRSRTNTPLQALILMNDPTYVESSRKLAERIMTESASDTDARLAFAFRQILSRPARPAEVAILKRLFDGQSAHFKQSPDAAKKLLAVGESPRNEKLDPVEHAAWTMVASALLNLDEAVTK